VFTASSFREWAICAPAAVLGYGGRFTGPLSGTEPQFSTTSQRHGSPLHYHRKLIGVKVVSAATFARGPNECHDSTRTARRRIG